MAKKFRSLSPGRSFDTFWVMINLSGPRYWKISPEGIEKTGAPTSQEGPVISFDETADFRVAYPKKGSLTQAAKFFLTEKQEKCRVFAGPKLNLGDTAFTPFYGTSVHRISQFEHRLFPGSYYVDLLLGKKKVKLEEDRVVGFRIESEQEDSFCIIVLFAIRPNGEMSEPQVSLNPPELDLIIRDYAQSNGVSNFEPILFTIEDLNSVQQGTGYPIETMIGNMPVRYLTSIAAMGLLGLSGVSFAYSGYLWLNIEHNKTQVKVAEQKAKEARAKVEAVVKNNLPQLAERTSIDYNKVFDYASKIYSPTVQIENAVLTRERGVLNTTVSIVKSTGGKDVFNSYESIDSILNQTLPEGLTRGSVFMGGDSNAYKVQFEFKTLDSDLNSLVGTK